MWVNKEIFPRGIVIFASYSIIQFKQEISFIRINNTICIQNFFKFFYLVSINDSICQQFLFQFI